MRGSTVAIKRYIWPTIFYGADTWKTPKLMLSRRVAFDMGIYRRVLNISHGWIRLTRRKPLRRTGTGREIVRQFKTSKLQYITHLIRHNKTQLDYTTNGRQYRRIMRSRGRPRMIWIGLMDLTKSRGAKY